MANVLVNDKWVELNTDGKIVADVLADIADDVPNANGLSVKADGILLAHGDVLSNQQTIEVVELPYLATDGDSATDVGSADDVDSTDTHH